jgi:hypothetical protein
MAYSSENGSSKGAPSGAIKGFQGGMLPGDHKSGQEDVKSSVRSKDAKKPMKGKK